MIRIVALLGDDHHPAEWSREAIETALSSEVAAGKVSISYPSEESFTTELVASPQLVIVCKANGRVMFVPGTGEVQYDAATGWMTDSVAHAITSYVEAGGRLFCWHAYLGHYESYPSIRSMIRGHFVYYPKQKSIKFHDVLEGGKNQAARLEIYDEHYSVQCDIDQTDVFLWSASSEGDSAAGWRHSYGKGKVAVLTPAHNRENLRNLDFIKLLRESMLSLLIDQGVGEKLG